MTGDLFDEYCVILSNLAAGTAPPWNAGLLRLYEIGLRNVPDALADPLAVLTVDRHKFRPSVAQIKEMAHEIQHGPQLSLPDALIEVNQYIDRLGTWGKTRPGKVLSVVHPDGTRHEREMVFRWLSDDIPTWSCPEIARAVDAMGGWQELATTEPRYWISRFERIYQSVISGAKQDDVRRLHSEYVAQQQLSAPAAQLEQGDYEES